MSAGGEGAAALRVTIASKRFGASRVLQGVRFAAAPGEVVAVLAPSGTGKTTLLRIALGLDRAFDGRVVRPPGRVGTVFQEPRLLPWLDVASNLRLVEPSLEAAALDGLLCLVGLGGAGRLMPAQLSLGMARRVALARAMSVRPALLVLDEPFASLDARLAASLARAVTAQARAMGTVTLMATHDLDQALDVADRLLVLQGTAPAVMVVRSTSREELLERFGFLRG